MAYSDKVVDHYNNPRNVGSFTKDTPGVGTGLVGAPECGDVMKLQIKVNLDTGVIEDAKIKNTDIVSELKLPPVKIHCSVLAEDAIKAALTDYKDKYASRLAGAGAAA